MACIHIILLGRLWVWAIFWYAINSLLTTNGYRKGDEDGPMDISRY